MVATRGPQGGAERMPAPSGARAERQSPTRKEALRGALRGAVERVRKLRNRVLARKATRGAPVTPQTAGGVLENLAGQSPTQRTDQQPASPVTNPVIPGSEAVQPQGGVQGAVEVQPKMTAETTTTTGASVSGASAEQQAGATNQGAPVSQAEQPNGQAGSATGAEANKTTPDTGTTGAPKKEGDPTGTVEQPMTASAPPPEPQTEASQRSPEEVAAEAKLVTNKEYQDKKTALKDAPEFARGREIDNMVRTEQVPGETPEARQQRLSKEQDAQDNAIDGLNPDERRQYQQYVETREYVKLTRLEASFDIRAEEISAREAGVASLPQAEQLIAQEKIRQDKVRLAQDRTDASMQRDLAVDEQYQANKRRAGRIERAIRRLRHQGEQAYSDDWIQKLIDGGVSWSDIQDHKQYLVGEGKIFKDKKAFQEYQKVRDERNDREDHVRNKQMVDRISDGSMSDDEIKDMLENNLAKMRRGPGKIRKGMRVFGQKLENWFGSGLMKEHKKKASGLAKGLIDTYGWKGLFAQRLLPKDRQRGAKIMRNLMWQEVRAYAGRRALRGAMLWLVLSFAVTLLTPVVIAKTIDVVKPFSKQ